MKKYTLTFLVGMVLIIFASLQWSCLKQYMGEPQLAPGDSTQILIISTTDLHGWVRGWNYNMDEPEPQYSMAKAATVVDSLRKQHRHNLLLDAGDWLQGNPFAEYYARVDDQDLHYGLLRAADAMRYDAIVNGNHEYNYGIEYLDGQIARTQTPVLGANIYKHGTDEPAYKPYIITKKGGVNVAVIGLTTPGSAVWDRPRVEGRLDFADGVETARRFVTEVREKGAELVVILAHSGFDGESSYHREGLGMENFGKAILDNVRGIDAMVLGHRHRVLELDYQLSGTIRMIPVIESGQWGSHVGTISLSVTRDYDGNVSVYRAQTGMIETKTYKEHPEIVALVEEDHQRVRAYITAPIAHSDDLWSTSQSREKDTPAIDLIQQAQLEATGAQLSAAAAFTTNLDFGNGEITLGQMASLYPYENTLYKMKLSGKQIRDFLEHTSRYYQTSTNGRLTVRSGFPGYNFDMFAGLDYIMDVRKEPGSRITKLEYQGRPIRDADTFTVAINSYRAEGGGGFDMMAGAEILEVIDRSVRDIIIDYLKQKGTISHTDVFQENWKLVY